jgi:hypothetical protein
MMLVMRLRLKGIMHYLSYLTLSAMCTVAYPDCLLIALTLPMNHPRPQLELMMIRILDIHLLMNVGGVRIDFVNFFVNLFVVLEQR